MANAIIVCNICLKSDDNPKEYGEFMFKDKISVHYYCLLLSTHLMQRGKDKSGILGFLIHDIRKEIKSAKSRICIYCNKKGASIKCSKCEVYFHYICGNTENCVSQFHDEFISFCHQHYDIKHSSRHSDLEGCVICFESIGEYNPVTSIAGQCCSLGWAHRKCIRYFALTAGYYLRCPFCKEKSFRDDIRNYGVFVPDREADWESKKGEFQYFCETIISCESQLCICPKGRKHQRSNGNWQILNCCGCGSSGTHFKCLKNTIPNFGQNDDFKCSVCINIFNETIQVEPTLSCPINRRNNTIMFSMLTHSFIPGNMMSIDTSNRLPEIPMVKNAPNSPNISVSKTADNCKTFEYALIKDKKIVGFAKGNLKSPAFSNQTSFVKDDFNNLVVSKNDKVLDQVIADYLKKKNLKASFCMEVPDSDGEEQVTVEQLLEKMMNELTQTDVEMPKPLLE